MRHQKPTLLSPNFLNEYNISRSRVYNVAVAARLLCISPQTLRKAAKDGKIKLHKSATNRKFTFKGEDLLYYLDNYVTYTMYKRKREDAALLCPHCGSLLRLIAEKVEK